MATLTEHEYDAIAQLWSQLDNNKTCMLWVTGSGQHPQPMTLFPDNKSGFVWFISHDDTDLVQAVGDGAEAAFTVQAKHGDYHASLIGDIEITKNEEKLDEFWSFGVAAWFEHGREDPKITLLKCTPREAAIWETESNAIKVGVKLLRTAMKEGDDTPGVGQHHILDLKAA